MSVLTAIINVYGRIMLLLIQQLFVVAMSVGRFLGSAVAALFQKWKAAKPVRSKPVIPRPYSRRRNRQQRQQRSWR